MNNKKQPKGHKPNCQCCICKAIRHEPLSEEIKDKMKLNRKGMKLHKENCQCFICRAKRHEKLSDKTKKRIGISGKLAYKEERRESATKGKTYEEYYGVEKALKIKEGQSINGQKKHNMTKEGSLAISIAASKRFKGVEPANKGKENKLWQREKNPRWNPNKQDLYGYEFTEKLKNKIRKRDNYTCQNITCEMTNKESLEKWGAQLCIHHIDRNKLNNNDENLTSLCKICHGKLERNTVILKNFEYREVINK